MIPDLYKIAGELCPAVLHVTARSLATSSISIYNDHNDIYAARMSGIPMLYSNGVQEAHDLAAISYLTTIKTGLPIINFFNGFRISHKINTYEEIDNETIKPLVDEKGLVRISACTLNPEHPKIRKPYEKLPAEVENMMEQFGKVTGRRCSRCRKPHRFDG